MRGSPQIKILVVDDESDNAQMFDTLLTREGYGVTTLADPTKVLGMLKEQLSENVKDVRLSSRLTESAACLVTDTYDLPPHLEQMMRAMGQDVPSSKRILELNPDHDVVKKLSEKASADDVKDYAELLYGQALLAEGGVLPDPAGFSKRVANLLAKAL